MEYFKFKRNNLYCEKVSVKKLAEEHKTPLYIYSSQFILDRFRQIKESFDKVKPLVCYSVKANSNLSILKGLVKKGAGLDIVSGGELYRAKKAGCKPERIVYAGVGKTDKEIEAAVKAGILMFNVESFSELLRINNIAGKLKARAGVSLRINPDIMPGTHAYITTGKKETKFGIDIDSAKKIFLNRNKYSNLDFLGVHIHIGSQITSISPFTRAVKKIMVFLDFLDNRGIKIKYLNIGGGFGVQYGNQKVDSIKEFADKLVPLLKKSGLKIILEPGRYIAGNAGILVVKVLYIKNSPVKRFIVVDGAMNDFIRPSLYQAYHRIIPLEKQAPIKSLRVKMSDVVGPVCESGDFLGKNRKLPVEEGQYLAVMGAGAYGQSMASNYNSRPKPAEVLVKAEKSYLIRRRDKYHDLVRKEILI